MPELPFAQIGRDHAREVLGQPERRLSAPRGTVPREVAGWGQSGQEFEERSRVARPEGRVGRRLRREPVRERLGAAAHRRAPARFRRTAFACRFRRRLGGARIVPRQFGAPQWHGYRASSEASASSARSYW